MSFIEIKNYNSHVNPSNLKEAMRLTKANMSISDDILVRFSPEIELSGKNTKNKMQKIKVGVAADPELKQLKLLPSAKYPFSFRQRADRDGTTWRAGMPKGLKALGMPSGTYTLTNPKELIFSLSEKREEN